MIRFTDVGVAYPGADPVLHGVDLDVAEGELCLVVGRTGTGKSTLLGVVNGLVPQASGGTLHGRVELDGVDVTGTPPRDLAHLVGVVGQDPLAGFVTDTVEDELAYGMEQLAVPPLVMRTRVEETLDLLGIADLRSRSLRTLSGGQQQRVAIGSVLTAGPRVLVLDEPTSALDPTAAEEVLAAITRLVHDLGMTVLVAEHRMERVVQYADRVLHLDGRGGVRSGTPAEVFGTADIAPPVVQLGRLLGWAPLPMSVRDARRLAGPTRERLAAVPPVTVPAARTTHTATHAVSAGEPALRARGVGVRYGDVVAVRGVDLDLRPGQVVALMGRNGSGKSSLLWALQGSGRRSAGRVEVRGEDPARLPAARARSLVALVPQTPGDLLYRESVDDECVQADREADVPEGRTRHTLDELLPDVPGDQHPRDLSEGQRLALVLAVQLVAGAAVVLLDEPTRGLDYGAKQRFSAAVARLAGQGCAVVVATHDVELVAGLASRTLVMAEGEVVADGATDVVLGASPGLAPQVSRVLAPQTRWLTVDQVGAALAGTGGAA